MCRTRTLTYACGHAIPVRLGTCRGTFTYETRRKERVAMCTSTPQFAIQAGGKCGSCERESAEEELNHDIGLLRQKLVPTEWLSEIPEELVLAETEYARQQYLVERKFPDGRCKKMGHPEKGRSLTCISMSSRDRSLLRREVKAEEVVQRFEPNKFAVAGGWEDWGEGHMSLEDELEENRREREERGLEICQCAVGENGLDEIRGDLRADRRTGEPAAESTSRHREVSSATAAKTSIKISGRLSQDDRSL